MYFHQTIKLTLCGFLLSFTTVTLSANTDATSPNPDSEEAISLLEVPELTQEELLDKQKNLARWHMNAVMYDASADFLNPITWEETDSTESLGALMTDDPTAAFSAPVGISRFVIDLSDFYIIDRFNFKNFTAVGSVQLFYSDSLNTPDAKSWVAVDDPQSFDSEAVLSPTFTPFESRYLMVLLDITQPGDIGNMGAFGNLSLAEVKLGANKRDEDIAVDTSAKTNAKPVKFNYASAGADSRVTYVSSGVAGEANSMIDDDVESFYDFEGGDEESIVIVDLGEQREVNRVSMLFDSPPGEFDFFIVNKLPDDVQKAIDDAETGSNATNSNGSLSKPADDDMAMIYNNGRLEPLLLAQNGGGDAIGSIVSFTADAIFNTVQLPAGFFSSLTPTVQEAVTGSDERFRLDFSNLSGRFLIVRFTPSPGSPGGLRVYEISLMGDVSADDEHWTRLPIFQLIGGGSPLGDAPTKALSTSAPPPNVRPLPPPLSP
ncbi:MAG: hypothetical protein AAFX93_00270 [Verrucomicrobiota bacterium]